MTKKQEKIKKKIGVKRRNQNMKSNKLEKK